jgi:hypothetical protein
MAPLQLHLTSYIIIGAHSAARIAEIYGSILLAGPGLDLYVVNLEWNIKKFDEILR